MKKLFTTMAMTALVAASATAGDYDEYTCDPEQGVVTQLSKVVLTFPGLDDVDNYDRSAIQVTRDGESLGFTITDRDGENFITVNLNQTASEPGTYVFQFSSEALYGYVGWDEGYCPAITLTYVIEEGGDDYSAMFDGYYSNPEEGVVSDLNAVKITFPNLETLNINDESKFHFTCDGQPLGCGVTKSAGYGTISVYLNQQTSKAGEYQITIDPEALIGYVGDIQAYNNEIKLNFTIAETDENPNGGFGSKTISPAPGVVEELSTVTLTFPNSYDIDIYPMSVGGISVTHDGQNLGFTIKKTNSYNGIEVKLNQTATEPGEYKLIFAAESLLSWSDNEPDGYAYNQPFEVVYTIDAQTGTTIVEDQVNYPVYNIHGIRMADDKNLPAGLYIVNGKKVVVK